jgi:hypothetical protein
VPASLKEDPSAMSLTAFRTLRDVVDHVLGR